MTKLIYYIHLGNNMCVQRKLKKTCHNARHFPAVRITAPRQSGKNTFLKHEARHISYVTFDDPLNRDFALKDANGFWDLFKGNPVSLDEIQYVPELLQYIIKSASSVRR